MRAWCDYDYREPHGPFKRVEAGIVLRNGMWWLAWTRNWPGRTPTGPLSKEGDREGAHTVVAVYADSYAELVVYHHGHIIWKRPPICFYAYDNEAEE